jgi:hypothetical protein
LHLIVKLQRTVRVFLRKRRMGDNGLPGKDELRKNKTKGCHRPNQSSIKFKSHMNKPSMDRNFEMGDKKSIFVEKARIDNALYTGEIVDGLRHGKGVQIWDDGAKYDGEWKFDKANGTGTFYHIDGDIYQGQWENDRANGEGTYINSEGVTYQGQWRDDIQEGYGIEVWNDNSSYKGHYKDGKKDGFGLYHWADGSKYEGEWRDNKLNGKGTYIWYDGRKYTGEFKDNFMHGLGHYIWGDGREYLGKSFIIKVTMLMIKRMALVNTNGLMEENMSAIGKMANKMAMASIFSLITLYNMACGNEAKDLIG